MQEAVQLLMESPSSLEVPMDVDAPSAAVGEEMARNADAEGEDDEEGAEEDSALPPKKRTAPASPSVSAFFSEVPPILTDFSFLS